MQWFHGGPTYLVIDTSSTLECEGVIFETFAFHHNRANTHYHSMYLFLPRDHTHHLALSQAAELPTLHDPTTVQRVPFYFFTFFQYFIRALNLSSLTPFLHCHPSSSLPTHSHTHLLYFPHTRPSTLSPHNACHAH